MLKFTSSLSECTYRSRQVPRRGHPPSTSDRFFPLKMSLRQLFELERGPIEDVIRWLQGRALLANPLHCGQCNEDMELRPRGDEHIDGFRW